MPNMKHLTRKEGKAQRASTSLHAQAASLLTMDVRPPRLGLSSPLRAFVKAATSPNGFEGLPEKELAAMFIKADALVLSDEPGAKDLRKSILAGPGHEEAQREALDCMIPPLRLEDRANLATVQEALNVVIGLDLKGKKGLPLGIDSSSLETHQAKMGRIIAYCEILQERVEETGLGLKLWATSEWTLELAQEASDGCAKWLEIERKQGEAEDHLHDQAEARSSGSIELDTEATSEASYDFLESSRLSSADTDDSASTSSKASTHVPNNYFGAYQEELEKTATSGTPSSADPETEEKIKKVEASLQSFYQIQDAAEKRNVTFVEASTSPRWLLGALLQARMAIELLEKKGQPTLTRYQQYALDLARRAEGEFEKMQRSEEERGGPEVWGGAYPIMGLTTTSSKKKNSKSAGPQEHDSNQATPSDLAEATHSDDLASSMPAVPDIQPFVIPGSGEDLYSSGVEDEGDEDCQERERCEEYEDKDDNEDAQSEGGNSDATDSSAEINAWAAEAVRMRFGGDTAAGAERARCAIFAGPGHEAEQQEVRNMLFPPWNPPEDRARFTQVQEALNIVLGIPGVKQTRTGIDITVEADILERNRAAMERIIDYYADLQERRVGTGRDGDIMGTQKVIIFYAQQAWGVCDELLEELERQQGQV